MVNQHPTALATLMAELQRILEGCPSDASEDLAHVSTGIGPRRADGAVVGIPLGNGNASRYPHTVKIDLTLRQGTLPDLVQRLALGNPLEVQRDDHGDAMGQSVAIEKAVAVVGAHQAKGDLR